MIGAAKPPSSQSNYVALKTVTHYPVLIGAPLESIKLFCPKNGYTLLSSDWCPLEPIIFVHVPNVPIDGLCTNHIRARAKRVNPGQSGSEPVVGYRSIPNLIGALTSDPIRIRYRSDWADPIS